MFMHVPQYLTDLRVMPRQGLYMGLIYSPFFFWTVDAIVFATGACFTLSKDAAQALVSYKPLAALLSQLYSIWRIMQYLSVSAHHEDVKVGHVLIRKIKFKGLTTVNVGKCKLHGPGTDGLFTVVTPKSVVVFHIREEDYQRLWKWFEDHGAPPAPSELHWFSKTSAALVC
ncbi:unnamed protein product [Trypanosoma congolense IL3000]|uniref:WGS project CAEQ00000000 data, annotated contig 2097 n=1 Tax=Trypanosoma congolense (strain IL3000) TaxID=1068625 RepID=F9WBE9_TRYCI|nr:unnamed protein product [Trypanosoma congolense IL3000]